MHSILQLRRRADGGAVNPFRFVYVSADRYSSRAASLSLLAPIRLGQMSVPQIHAGTFLACRTAAPSACPLGVLTLIEDTCGDHCLLYLPHFQRNLLDDSNIRLPQGTLLIIREPFLKFYSTNRELAIVCESPTDFVICHESNELLRGTKFWIPLSASFDELKASGNQLFGQRLYERALFQYDLCLLKSPDNPTILSNKSAAFLALGYYWDAFACSHRVLDNAAVPQDKVLSRLARSAYGLGKWETALEYFTRLAREFPARSSTVSDDILRRLRRIGESRTCHYDMSEINRQALSVFTQGTTVYLDVANYTGPVRVGQVPGLKGSFNS
jgi:hypothetical protein